MPQNNGALDCAEYRLQQRRGLGSPDVRLRSSFLTDLGRACGIGRVHDDRLVSRSGPSNSMGHRPIIVWPSGADVLGCSLTEKQTARLSRSHPL